MYTNYYLREIEKETGYSPSLKPCSSIGLACNTKRMQLFERTKAFSDANGIVK